MLASSTGKGQSEATRPKARSDVTALVWPSTRMYGYLRMHEDTQGFAMPTKPQVSVASDAFRLLADPTRIRLLWALLQGESSVSCLAQLVGSSPTAVSQHLSKLRLAKLVTVRRQGTFAYYSAADDHMAALLSEALCLADRPLYGQRDHSAEPPRRRRRPGTVTHNGH